MEEVEEVEPFPLSHQGSGEGRRVPVPMTAEQIADDIADRIKRGEYKAGEQLPPYRVLADLYGVHVSTVARVMLILRARGTVVGVPGRGVFVPDAPQA